MSAAYSAPVGVVFGVLLLLGVACVVLDTARNRRPGASIAEVLREVGGRPSDWQLVAGGAGFVAAAFASRFMPWAGLASLPALGLVAAFLHASRPRRTRVPMPQEVLATPEPASNMRVVV